MRDYAKVSPKMWHGHTFKALRKRGSEGVVVGLYLMTSPCSNMLGLFAQPILYMAHETGLGEEGARKGLQSCIEACFCSYDEESEMVWVREMAKYQIADHLEAKDNRCKGIQKDYDALPDNPFLGDFFDAYQGAFHLTKRRGPGSPPKAPTKGPSKPLRSQEQEQEKEQEKGAGGAPSEGLGLEFVLPDWMPRDAWDGYVEMRKKQRKPMTDRARDLVIAELVKLREAKVDIERALNASTKNCWVDVYAPKSGGPGPAGDMYAGVR